MPAYVRGDDHVARHARGLRACRLRLWARRRPISRLQCGAALLRSGVRAVCPLPGGAKVRAPRIAPRSAPSAV
eukprot:15279854-Alexandrium_andersonii.AAC.1